MTVALENATRVVGAVPFIRDVSLTLEPGTLSVLLGPTLSGKTSLMRLLAGLDPPTAGRVVVNGKDVTGIDVRKRSVAMVYQQFVNYPSFTVFENIASPLRVQGRPNEEVERRVRRGREPAAAGTLPRPHAARPVGRPAAAHRDRPRAGQGRRPSAARRAAGQSRLQAARGAARRAAAHLRGVGRHLRLRHHRAVGGAAAGRPDDLPVGGPRPAGRRHVGRLPPAGQPAGGGAVLRSAAQHRGHREEGRRRRLWRRRHGAGQRPLCRAGRRALQRGLPRPPACRGQRRAPAITFFRRRWRSPKSPARKASSISSATA